MLLLAMAVKRPYGAALRAPLQTAGLYFAADFFNKLLQLTR